jgi:hypothetical protein
MTAPTDLFEELAAESGNLQDTWIGSTYYRAVPVTEVRDGDLVLPVGWGSPAKALAWIDPGADLDPCGALACIGLDERHVKLHWEFGPDPYTIFGRTEKVLIDR